MLPFRPVVAENLRSPFHFSGGWYENAIIAERLDLGCSTFMDSPRNPAETPRAIQLVFCHGSRPPQRSLMVFIYHRLSSYAVSGCFRENGRMILLTLRRRYRYPCSRTGVEPSSIAFFIAVEESYCRLEDSHEKIGEAL